MDFITHVLAGACIARAGLNRKTKLATVTVVLAAEAPDLDVLARLKGPISGFAHDRGFTHSFLGAAVVSGAVVCVMYALFRLIGSRIKDPRLGPRWGLLLGFAYLAGLTHILLDFTDNYGVRPYWPFSDRRYSWDIGLLIDPVAAILLFGGLMLSVLSSLMNAEHGRSRKVPVGRLAAGLALMGVVAVWGIRDYEHRRALHALEVRQYRGAKSLRTSAFPSWWNPFLWRGVVETPNFVASIRVNSSSQELAALDETQIRYKPQETPETLAAKNTYLGRAYMNWARHPITETEPLELGERGYIVRISDLRFERAGREHYFPSVSVRLNRDLSIADMSFGEQDPPY